MELRGTGERSRCQGTEGALGEPGAEGAGQRRVECDTGAPIKGNRVYCVRDQGDASGWGSYFFLWGWSTGPSIAWQRLQFWRGKFRKSKSNDGLCHACTHVLIQLSHLLVE